MKKRRIKLLIGIIISIVLIGGVGYYIKINTEYTVDIASNNLKSQISKWLGGRSLEVNEIHKLGSSNTTIVSISFQSGAEGIVVMKQGENGRYKITKSSSRKRDSGLWVSVENVNTNKETYAVFYGKNSGDVKSLVGEISVKNEDLNKWINSERVITIKLPNRDLIMETTKIPTNNDQETVVNNYPSLLNTEGVRIN
ncbi:hypothetical protein WAK64_00965 [Bacillus spongiae]|uniref:Uncharacterized protein n=1 Tax=Bacillus spongiae TaxID=2683610 RepID=A0ABU8H8J2_9BACI